MATTDVNVTSTGTTGTTGGTSTVGQQTGTESSLSNWVGPYVTSMLGQGQALANQPYQTYTGPLTAGPSALQQQSWSGIAGLQVPSSMSAAADTAGQAATKALGTTYLPTEYTTSYTAPGAYAPGNISTGKFTDPGVAQQYMNPYVQTALNPQIEEARRQSEIENLKNRTAATRAGAYGGSRQALMESENQRNLLQNLANITGTGYKTAYEQGAQQYTSDQARALQAQQAAEQAKQFGYGQQMTAAQLAAQYGLDAQKATELSKQFGSNLGLQSLQAATQAASAQGQLGGALNQQQLANIAAQGAAGQAQRDIEQQGIAADYAQFQEARDYPYKQVQYMQSLLQGLPLAAQSYSYSQPSTLSNILGSAGGIQQLYNQLFGGTTSATTGS